MGQLSGRLRCPASVWHKAVGNIAQPLAPLLLLPFRLLRQAQLLALLSSWDNCLCHLWWHRQLTYTTEVQCMMLSSAPSFNNGGCG